MKRTILCLAVLAAPALAFSQGDSLGIDLPAIVITEKRLGHLPFEQEARNITVIHSRELQALPVQTVQEVLSYVAGVDLRQRGPLGAQADITLMGGTFEQVLVLINGIPMRDAQTGHHQANLPIDLQQIERIEVLKGSAARIYGANALAGAINIVTKDPGREKLRVQAFAGSPLTTPEEKSTPYGLGGGRVSLGFRSSSGKAGHQVDLSLLHTDGYRFNSSNTQQRAHYLGRYQFGQGTMDVQAGTVLNRFGANGYYAYPYDAQAEETVETTYGGIHYYQKVGRWTFRPLAYLRYNHDDYIFVKQDPSIYRNNHFTTSGGIEFHASHANAVGSLGLGVESRTEIIRSNNLGHRERYYQSIYAEQRFDWGIGSTITVGMNAQYTNDYGVRFYPGIEMSTPLYYRLHAFANAGLGSRLPTYTDLYYSDRANVGNPELSPEEALYGEAGLKWYDERIDLQASAFWRKTNDFIDFVRENDTLQWQPQNFRSVQHYGADLRLRYLFGASDRMVHPVYFRTGFTWLNGELESGDLLSKYALDHLRVQSATQLVIATTKYLQHTFSFRYIERFRGGEYGIADYRVSALLGDWVVSADATNLFDRHYTEQGFIPMPGRWFRLSVTWRLS